MSGVLTFSGSITLADSNPLTAIYYTTDGSTPTLPLGSTNTTSLHTGPVSYGGITGNIPNPTPSVTFNALAVSGSFVSTVATVTILPTCGTGR
jgi:hypothetical protein